MSWSIITTNNVLEEFTPVEQSALKNIQGATDNLPAILARVVAMTRGNIVAGGTDLGTAGTVPDQLGLDVISIARWRWLTALPQARTMQTGDRKAAHDDAMARLQEVAKGTLRVESASESTSSAVNSPKFGTRGGTRDTDPRERQFTPETQDGI